MMIHGVLRIPTSYNTWSQEVTSNDDTSGSEDTS